MHSNQFNAAPPSLYGHHPFVPEVLPDFHDEVQFPKYKQEKMDYNEKADFKDIRQYLSFQEYILCKHYCSGQSTVDEAIFYRSQGKKLKFSFHNGVGLVHCIVGSKAPDQQTQLREDQVANWYTVIFFFLNKAQTIKLFNFLNQGIREVNLKKNLFSLNLNYLTFIFFLARFQFGFLTARSL